MKFENSNDLKYERMYSLGVALLKYFNGKKITSAEAKLISECDSSDIIPSIKLVQAQLVNNKEKNYFFESTKLINVVGAISGTPKKMK